VQFCVIAAEMRKWLMTPIVISIAYSGDFDRLFRPNVTEDSAGSAL
jgi:hypothetical protein